jgi:3-dehydroquinate dehydratase
LRNLTSISRPYLVSVICEQDVGALAQAVEDSVKGGADAIEMNLSQLPDYELEEVARLVTGLPIPVYTACRRRDFMAVYGHSISELVHLDDEKRIERQLRLLEPAVCIDMEFDTFAADEAEVLPGLPLGATECAQSDYSKERQREIIEAIHSKGLEVVLSSHTSAALAEFQIVALAQTMRMRGADIIKIINTHAEAGYCAEIFKATLTLRSILSCPFVLSSMGPGSTILRWMACHFGCTYTFCRVPNLKYFYQGHPKLTELRRLFVDFPPEVALKETADGDPKTPGRSTRR